MNELNPFPPIRRRSMVYRPYDAKARVVSEDSPSLGWTRIAVFRRLTLLFLTIFSAGYGGSILYFILLENKAKFWHVPMVALFTFLFGWIAANFWIGFFGFYVLASRRSRFRILENENLRPVESSARIAVTIPIYNEDPSHVFAGLGAIYRSIEKTGELDRFDFFVLSDSSDPDHRVAEQSAWAALRSELGPLSRIYYRHRKNRIQKKSGNIADFCRRWGSQYRYMIVLDADSLMTGDLALKMFRVMEARTDIGILQTVPRAVMQKSLIARVNQFASHVYGPVFAAGFHFWQLGDAGFWGHNAIIRVEEFTRFAALPKINKELPFGGEILSHDFVEAALLRRCGLGIWLAYDFEGGYEQVPPNLLTELDRDRRWFQGNLQHLHFLGMKGTSMGYRILFVMGNLFYFCSFIWFAFLCVVTASVIQNRIHVPDYFSSQRSLFPDWPVYHNALSFALLIATSVFLFIPKVLSILIVALRKQSADYGGMAKLIPSVAAEVVFSMFLAPIRMVFHSYYFILLFFGKKIDWKAPPRSERRTTFSEALRAHGPGTLIAFIWAFVIYFVDRMYFVWALLFLVPLALSIVSSVWTSRVDSGMAFKKKGLFLIPEEIQPPLVLTDFQEGLKKFSKFSPGRQGAMKHAFCAAILDPQINHLVRQLARPRNNSRVLSTIQHSRQALVNKAFKKGPASLSRQEKNRILADSECIEKLRALVQSAPDADRALWK